MNKNILIYKIIRYGYYIGKLGGSSRVYIEQDLKQYCMKYLKDLLLKYKQEYLDIKFEEGNNVK